MSALVWLKGRITPPSEALISVFDRGFLFGDGVYETGRSYDRCFLYLEEHLARLRHSAAKLRIPVIWKDEDLTRSLTELAQKFQQDNVYFRTILTRGVVEKVGLDVSLKDLTPTLVHVVQELSLKTEEQRGEGITLKTSSVVRNSARSQDPNIKTSNYLNSLLALFDAKDGGRDDAILCDAKGRVTEGTTFSIFGVTKTGEVITPDLSVGILESITRRHVLELSRKRYVTKEGFFKLAEFMECTEIFAVSSIREIIPVREWDGKSFAADGPVWGQLHKDLKDEISRYINAHPKY